MSGMRTIKSGIYRWIAGLTCLGLVLTPRIPVHAEESATVMQSAVEGSQLHLYIRGLEDYDSMTAQIAMTAAEVSDVSDEVEVHTVFLLDNSLSITGANQEKIQKIISDYAAQKDDSEKISIAVYGEEITYLAEKETDGSVLAEFPQQIEYKNQDSYLTDILYDEVAKFQKAGEYTRFIVAADGADDKAIGYTLNELESLLKRKNYPVYALGCTYKDNSKELENLFSIARLTQAKYFLLDDYEDVTEISELLREQITDVSIMIPEECMDGSEKSVLLSVETDGGIQELTVSASMPFSLKEEKPEPVEEAAPVEEEPEEPEPVVVAEPVVAEPEPIEQESSVDYVSLAAGVVVVIAVILLVLYQLKSKKKKGDVTDKAPEAAKVTPENVSAEPSVDDVSMMPVEEEEEGTVFLAGNADNYIVVLKDINHPERIFRYPLRDRVVIGRKNENGVHIVINYDASVSGRHCEITAVGDRFFIEDLHSANKTHVDGELVEGRKEFKSGSILEMGRVKMRLELVRMR